MSSVQNRETDSKKYKSNDPNPLPQQFCFVKSANQQNHTTNMSINNDSFSFIKRSEVPKAIVSFLKKQNSTSEPSSSPTNSVNDKKEQLRMSKDIGGETPSVTTTSNQSQQNLNTTASPRNNNDDDDDEDARIRRMVDLQNERLNNLGRSIKITRPLKSATSIDVKEPSKTTNEIINENKNTLRKNGRERSSSPPRRYNYYRDRSPSPSYRRYSRSPSPRYRPSRSPSPYRRYSRSPSPYYRSRPKYGSPSPPPIRYYSISPPPRRVYLRSPSPPPRRRRYSISPSPPPRRRYSRSPSLPPRRRYSRSPSPPRRRYSRSPSTPPRRRYNRSISPKRRSRSPVSVYQSRSPSTHRKRSPPIKKAHGEASSVSNTAKRAREEAPSLSSNAKKARKEPSKIKSGTVKKAYEDSSTTSPKSVKKSLETSTAAKNVQKNSTTTASNTTVNKVLENPATTLSSTAAKKAHEQTITVSDTKSNSNSTFSKPPSSSASKTKPTASKHMVDDGKDVKATHGKVVEKSANGITGKNNNYNSKMDESVSTSNCVKPQLADIPTITCIPEPVIVIDSITQQQKDKPLKDHAATENANTTARPRRRFTDQPSTTAEQQEPHTIVSKDVEKVEAKKSLNITVSSPMNKGIVLGKTSSKSFRESLRQLPIDERDDVVMDILPSPPPHISTFENSTTSMNNNSVEKKIVIDSRKESAKTTPPITAKSTNSATSDSQQKSADKSVEQSQVIEKPAGQVDESEKSSQLVPEHLINDGPSNINPIINTKSDVVQSILIPKNNNEMIETAATHSPHHLNTNQTDILTKGTSVVVNPLSHAIDAQARPKERRNRLPPSWKVKMSDEGDIYYVNVNTGEETFTRPEA